MARILFVLSAALFSHPASASTPLLSYVELEAIAKSAVQEEVRELNAIVADYLDVSGTGRTVSDWRGYRPKHLKIFRTYDKPEGVEADVIHDVCILTRETIGAISSRRISKANLKVNSSLNSVNSLRGLMNDRFFAVAERACLNAKARFIERMKAATTKGRPLGFSEQAIENIAHVVFFPTDYAKPTLGKRLLKAIPVVIQATLFVKGVSAFTGWVMSGVWMSIVAVSGPALSLKNLAPRSDELFKQRDVSNLDIDLCDRIDLSESERSFMPPAATSRN